MSHNFAWKKNAREASICRSFYACEHIAPEKSPYRNVWSAAVLQAKNEEWQLVCANVFGLEWSQ